jgi:hypothetical protein
MLDDLRMARAVRRQRQLVARRAELSERSRRRLVSARRDLASTIRRRLTHPLSLGAFFAAGFLLGPRRMMAASRLSAGSVAALLLAVRRAVDVFHRLSTKARPHDAGDHGSATSELDGVPGEASLLGPRS